MHIAAATASDLEPAVGRLVAAFAQDPITGFLLQAGPHYSGKRGLETLLTPIRV